MIKYFTNTKRGNYLNLREVIEDLLKRNPDPREKGDGLVKFDILL